MIDCLIEHWLGFTLSFVVWLWMLAAVAWYWGRSIGRTVERATEIPADSIDP